MRSDHAQEDSFRNHVSTMDSKGSRNWVYPKKPRGKYTRYRNYVSYVLLFILFISPFLHLLIPSLENQFFMLNVLDRKFSLFGFMFFTQDFFLFAIGMVTSLVFIILFTVVYGRIFCGWICPQTIFMEMVFRKIEYAIEGDRNRQMKLDRQEWGVKKAWKRSLKWSVFALISFLIANIFLMYVIGTERVLRYIIEGPLEHIELFFGLLIFTGIFYFVFAWFREQACTMVCPYGRLQSVLIDPDTIVVAYDYKRGEGSQGRAKFRKKVDRRKEGIGDCIDCDQCVVVCPTGIDIRNGTQLECINCTACMDACDEVMNKVGFKTGLIRYTSEFSIEHQIKPRFTFRSKAYTVLLILLTGLLTSLLFMRSDYDVKIFHQRGNTKSYETKGKFILNTYEFIITNKTSDSAELKFKLIEPRGHINIMNNENEVLKLIPQETLKGRFKASVRQSRLLGAKELKIKVYNKTTNKLIDTKTVKYNKP
ncbi:MAG: cytochrome c oxidase accessory protein CcoG [Flavobacteriales bacterium]